MGDLPAVLLFGLVQASLYTLVGLGLTLTFGVTHILNFAHGEFVAIAALVLAVLVEPLGVPLAMLVSLIGTAVAGAAAYQLGFRRTIGNHLQGLALSLALLLVVETLLIETFTTVPRSGPRLLGTVLLPGGSQVAVGRFMVLAIAALCVIATWLALRYTWFGLAMRAAGDDELAATSLGITPRRTGLYAFVAAALLAAVAGFSIATVQPVTPAIGATYLLKGFVVVIIGGLGSPSGTLVASVMLGLSEAFGTRYVDPGLTDTYGLVLMIVVLLIAPGGLFARQQSRIG